MSSFCCFYAESSAFVKVPESRGDVIRSHSFILYNFSIRRTPFFSSPIISWSEQAFLVKYGFRNGESRVKPQRNVETEEGKRQRRGKNKPKVYRKY